MTKGIVKWFCANKGYGFIEPVTEEECADIFVHLTAVERSGYDTLTKGQEVLFALEDDIKKGRKSVVSVELI